MITVMPKYATFFQLYLSLNLCVDQFFKAGAVVPPKILIFKGLRQKDCEFEASLV